MEPMWAIILDIWKDEPVFHRRLPATEKTFCGRGIGTYKPFLPMKHVKRFARPCRGCFQSV